MKKIIASILLSGCCFFLSAQSQQLPSVMQKANGYTEIDGRTRAYISPQRIVWKYDGDGSLIENAEILLEPGSGQAGTNFTGVCTMRSTSNQIASILLDYGVELQGGLQLVNCQSSKFGQQPRVRIRFGESATEAMSEIGENGATNDHAMRDFIISVPWMGVIEVGNSGFRFVRIDLVEPNTELALKEVRAISTYYDIPYIGSFKSSDERLNQIWDTGAYTVHLNMQEHLWDGIKRDRLVWHGDMYPEVMTINAVFGYNEVVPKSLDYGVVNDPLPRWMNGFSAYSLWWLMNQRDWYYNHGNLDFLKKNRDYIVGLIDQVISKIDETGIERLDGGRFLDWPTSENAEVVHSGLQALMVMTMDGCIDICTALGEKEATERCREAVQRLRKHTPDAHNNKQAASLLSLAGMRDAKEMNKIVAHNGAEGFSTFYGYFMLQAMAKAGDYTGAMACIREYWGAMLDLGATTFWEDFDLKWTDNAARIDELVPDGKIDVHATYGKYCYMGFRHSLCHGWASGPTAWLSQHVLGVEVVEPGCKTVRIRPNLGNLQWAEGTYPTPKGAIKIRHEKQANGKIVSKIEAPKGIKVIK